MPAFLDALIKKWRPTQVIPRGQCSYRCFDLSSVPARDRREALHLRALQWVPGEQMDFNVVWHGAQAQLWSWQKTTGQGLARTLGSAANAVVETRLYPPPAQSGVRLQVCEQGYEATYWSDGVLCNSHWWPQLPAVQDWVNFQRSAGLKPEARLPQPESVTASSKPWGRNTSLTASGTLRWEKPLWMTLWLSVVFGTGWFGWQIYQLTAAGHALELQRGTLEIQIEPILQARNSARQDQHKAMQVYSLRPDISQLQLLDDVVSKLPVRTWAIWQHGIQLVLWNLAQKTLGRSQDCIEAIDQGRRV